MKKITVLVIMLSVLVFSTSTTLAEKPDNFGKLITENIVSSLHHDIDGVVEATIYNSLFLTKFYPDAQIGKVLTALNDVAINSNNPVIRYKAQLAVLYLTNYGNEDLQFENYKGNPSQLFRKISEKLEKNLLAAQN